MSLSVFDTFQRIKGEARKKTKSEASNESYITNKNANILNMQTEREAKREAAREATQEAKREAEREAKREAESTLDLIFKFVFACFPYPSRAGFTG